MRAIIIEDEFLAAIHAETALERLGCEVVGSAEDSAGALQLVAEAPELALIDLNLRDGLTGPEIGARLAEQGIVVIFVTANPRDLAGFNKMNAPVLEKPLHEAELSNTLRSLQPGLLN